MEAVSSQSGAEAHGVSPLQHTLAGEVTRSGIGLHSGTSTQVTIRPAAAGEGRYFVRVDLPDAPVISAQIEAVNPTMLSTELVNGDAKVRTVEHLLASLAGLGVDNARIEIDGAEVPLLDGSAHEWAMAIADVGLVSQSARVTRSILEPIWIYEGDAFVAAIPAPALRFSYGIDFELAEIGNQWHSWSPDQDSFLTEIALARTFGLAHQIDQLRSSGLIKGGSLKNALVCGDDGWLNPPLRFSNEPVRHKLLDLVGDLSLLGAIPIAHFLAYKASHRLHTQLAQKISLTL
ncbi:UDP-3-O-acyl-N-acetylglucosamine deacetylase [Phormidesmis priestleyi]|uniref:UDP-3-O-acyl-N-acetylglucosamine deacetylase n=1 Tax=Phormidesmis priestleyi TaxID=268141 RepID=UPI00083ACACC|nr:UDP-3-O-acyl-N-acetylglucosamine deacetylase [Phormidesmis priestleyi]